MNAFDQDGFNRKGFGGDGFNRKGKDEYGYDRNKELACKEKLKQALRENPIIYQYATLRLKQNVDLAIFFVEQCGSFSLVSKHLLENKKVVMIAVEKNPKSFQYIGKKKKDDDDLFKLAFQQNEEIPRYASERLEKINIHSKIYHTRFLLTIFFHKTVTFRLKYEVLDNNVYLCDIDYYKYRTK